MYLDVDDSILIWSDKSNGFGAPKVAEFIVWALEHFEVRWLTMWAVSGRMNKEGAQELHYRLAHKISEFTLMNEIYNPNGFSGLKTDAIDFDDSRPWVWVEDRIAGGEYEVLTNRKLLDRFYRTNVSVNSIALQATWNKLAKKFNLPGPKMPYSTEQELPPILLEFDEIFKKWRK